MGSRINRERVKAFLLRRRLNALGLFSITVFSASITLICALIGFTRTDVLSFVTLLLILLCIVQSLRMRSSFRTIRSFKGLRKKKSKTAGE